MQDLTFEHKTDTLSFMIININGYVHMHRHGIPPKHKGVSVLVRIARSAKKAYGMFSNVAVLVKKLIGKKNMKKLYTLF